MRILTIVISEYLFGYILQGFMYCLGVIVLCNAKIEKQKFIISSIILTLIIYITRLLPVSFGIHTILDLICLFILAVLFIKTPASSAIRSVLIITVLLLITEISSIYVIENILGNARFDEMMSSNLGKAIIALPSSIIFSIIVFGLYVIQSRLKTKRRLVFGKNS